MTRSEATRRMATLLLLSFAACTSDTTGPQYDGATKPSFDQPTVYGYCETFGDDFPNYDAQWGLAGCDTISTFANQTFNSYITDTAWGIFPGSTDSTAYLLIVTFGFDSLFRATGGTGDSVPYRFHLDFMTPKYTVGSNDYFDVKQVPFSVSLPTRADFVMITAVPAYCGSSDGYDSLACINNASMVHDEPRICIRNPAAPSDVCERRVWGIDLYSGNMIGGHDFTSANMTVGNVGNFKVK